MGRRSRKRKSFSNILTCLILMIMTLSALPLTGLFFARADTYNSNSEGSIRAVLTSQPDSSGNDTIYTDVYMKLYPVGSVKEENGMPVFSLDSRFAGSGIKMETLTTADKWSKAARTLAGMAETSGIEEIEDLSDGQGVIDYGRMEKGVYLLVQSSAQDRITISPSLFTVPMQEDGRWVYDVTVYPKFQSVHQNDPEPTEKIIQTVTPTNQTDIQSSTISRTVSGTFVKAVKTGDNTPIMMWMVILFVATAAVGFVIARKKKK